MVELREQHQTHEAWEGINHTPCISTKDSSEYCDVLIKLNNILHSEDGLGGTRGKSAHKICWQEGGPTTGNAANAAATRMQTVTKVCNVTPHWPALAKQ